MNDNKGKFFGNLPLHLVIVLICLAWVIPTLGLLVTSLRPFQAVNETGWWKAFAPASTPGKPVYETQCAECHGVDGATIAEANLAGPEVVGQFRRSIALLGVLRQELPDGRPHVSEVPEAQAAADLLDYLKQLGGVESAATQARFTANNYVDATVGYSGRSTYRAACTGPEVTDDACFDTGLASERGMAQAFKNSLFVAVPATILPIIFAAFAAYALSWLDFRGRQWMFIALVTLQIVPLQMTLIPIFRLYNQFGLNGTFLGVWLFHTGFGLPYSIYLIRNFIGNLPRDLFESIYLDGASHWVAFWRLALPLSVPALAALAIFQFLWVWNDLLVALVFLGSEAPVLTWQISNLAGRFSGWHLLTAAAFLSIVLPMIVFFGMQRFFVRGLLGGAVKG